MPTFKIESWEDFEVKVSGVEDQISESYGHRITYALNSGNAADEEGIKLLGETGERLVRAILANHTVHEVQIWKGGLVVRPWVRTTAHKGTKESILSTVRTAFEDVLGIELSEAQEVIV